MGRAEVKPVDRIVKRTGAYYYEDGIVELVTAIVFAALAALFTAESLLGPRAAALSSFGLVAIVFGGVYGGRIAVRAFKDRVTHPRTGYVAFARPTRARRWQAAAAAVVAGAILAAVLALSPKTLRMLPLADGAVIAVFLLAIAFRLGLPRFFVAGVFSSAAGSTAALLAPSEIAGTALCFAAIAVILALSGAVALRTYLAQSRPAAAD